MCGGSQWHTGSLGLKGHIGSDPPFCAAGRSPVEHCDAEVASSLKSDGSVALEAAPQRFSIMALWTLGLWTLGMWPPPPGVNLIFFGWKGSARIAAFRMAIAKHSGAETPSSSRVHGKPGRRGPDGRSFGSRAYVILLPVI